MTPDRTADTLERHEVPREKERKMEEQLLGGLLLHRTTVAVALPLLSPENFRHAGNRTVFAAIVALHQAGLPADVVLVADHLQQQGLIQQAGGYYRLVDLYGAACAEEQVEPLARQLSDGE
jgi:replicative DNA helicase